MRIATRKILNLLLNALLLSALTHSVRAEEAKPEAPGTHRPVPSTKEWTADDSTSVNFIKGGSALTEAETLNLKALYERASNLGPVARILVVAWADKEGLKSNEKATEAQIVLAQKRAEVVKDVLVGLSQRHVESVNMAKDAGWIAKTFHTKEAEIKDAVKFPSAANETRKALATLLLQQGGLGKAVVILELEPKPGTRAVGR